MSDDETRIRARVEILSTHFESSQGLVTTTDVDDARATAAELLFTLSRQVAESIGQRLPAGDALPLAEALADRIGVALDTDGYIGLDLDRLVDRLASRYDGIKRDLDESREQSITNLNQFRRVQKLLDTVGLKARTERAVAGEHGWLGVDEVEAVLAGRAMPVGRNDHPLHTLKRDHDHTRAALDRVVKTASVPGRLLEAAGGLDRIISRIMDRHGVDSLYAVSERADAQRELAKLLDMDDEVDSAQIHIRVGELVLSAGVLRKVATVLDCRPSFVPTEVAALKAFHGAVAEAVGVSSHSALNLLVAEVGMIKSNLDMLRGVNRRIGALVVEELGIQEEALRPQDELDKDVKTALEYVRESNVSWQAQRDSVVLALSGRTGLNADQTRATPLDSLVRSAVNVWTTERRDISRALLSDGLTNKVDANHLADEVADALRRVREFTQAQTTEPLAKLIEFLKLPPMATAEQVLAGVRELAERPDQIDRHTLLPPSAEPVRVSTDGQLDMRVRAVRLREDIESERDVLFVRDLARPGVFESRGLDGSGVNYHWDTLRDNDEDQFVDASAEVRYRLVFSPATSSRDDQVLMWDAVADRSVDAFHSVSAANVKLRALHAAARPAMMR